MHNYAKEKNDEIPNMKIKCNHCGKRSAVVVSRKDLTDKSASAGAVSQATLIAIAALIREVVANFFAKRKDDERKYLYCDDCGALDELK